MASSEDSHLVFISHSGEDTWIAQQIAREIEALGVKTFLDEANIDAGDDFEEVFRDSINKASELLLLVTPWSLGRSYVLAEIGAAWSRGIPIIPILFGITIDELLTQANIPLFLKKRDMIRLNDIERYFQQLSKRISSNRVVK